MPEGDTVWLTATRLHDALAGQVVTTFDLRVPQLATSDLTGDTVREVAARGKHILMRFDNGQTLHSHLRMDGSWLSLQLARTESGACGCVRSNRAPPRSSRRCCFPWHCRSCPKRTASWAGR